MGYNSKASTAIRETGRMVRSVVEAVEDDKVFWYEECRLPATYQTFFPITFIVYLDSITPITGLASDGTTTSSLDP